MCDKYVLIDCRFLRILEKIIQNIRRNKDNKPVF